MDFEFPYAIFSAALSLHFGAFIVVYSFGIIRRASDLV